MADSEILKLMKTLYDEASVDDKAKIRSFLFGVFDIESSAKRMVQVDNTGRLIGQALRNATEQCNENYRIRGMIVNSLTS